MMSELVQPMGGSTAGRPPERPPVESLGELLVDWPGAPTPSKSLDGVCAALVPASNEVVASRPSLCFAASCTWLVR